MRLGIGSYTYVWSTGVAGYPQPDRPMTAFDLLDLASALQVDVVQIADNLPLHRLSADELNSLLRQAQKADLELETGTRGIAVEHLLRYLEISRRLESQVLRVVIDAEQVPGESPGHLVEPSVEDVVRALTDVTPAFEQADVRLAIENHDRFPALVLREIMQRVGSSHVGICLDTANSIGCVESASRVMDVLSPWIVNVHLKDYDIYRPRHQKGFVVEGRPVGSGHLDVPELLKQLRKTGYSRSVIVELWPPPQESLEASIRLEHEWAEMSVHYLQRLMNRESDPQP